MSRWRLVTAGDGEWFVVPEELVAEFHRLVDESGGPCAEAEYLGPEEIAAGIKFGETFDQYHVEDTCGFSFENPQFDPDPDADEENDNGILGRAPSCWPGAALAEQEVKDPRTEESDLGGEKANGREVDSHVPRTGREGTPDRVDEDGPVCAPVPSPYHPLVVAAATAFGIVPRVAQLGSSGAAFLARRAVVILGRERGMTDRSLADILETTARDIEHQHTPSICANSLTAPAFVEAVDRIRKAVG